MPTNFWIFFITALIPLIIGAIWYSPKIMGNTWMKVNGFKEEDMQGANMAVIFGLSYLFGIFISLGLSGIVIHQTNVYQMMMPDVMVVGSAAETQFNDLMAQFGTYHRSLFHGAIHGVFFCVLIVLPLLAINAMFERRGWKYIMVHFGYWMITLILISAILCETLVYA